MRAQLVVIISATFFFDIALAGSKTEGETKRIPSGKPRSSSPWSRLSGSFAGGLSESFKSSFKSRSWNSSASGKSNFCPQKPNMGSISKGVKSKLRKLRTMGEASMRSISKSVSGFSRSVSRSKSSKDGRSKSREEYRPDASPYVLPINTPVELPSSSCVITSSPPFVAPSPKSEIGEPLCACTTSPRASPQSSPKGSPQHSPKGSPQRSPKGSPILSPKRSPDRSPKGAPGKSREPSPDRSIPERIPSPIPPIPTPRVSPPMKSPIRSPPRPKTPPRSPPKSLPRPRGFQLVPDWRDRLRKINNPILKDLHRGASKVWFDEHVDDPHQRLYNQLQNQLLAYFVRKDPPLKEEFHEFMGYVQDTQAKLSVKEHPEAGRDFLRKYCFEHMPVDQIPLADSADLKQECIKRCHDTWGFVFIPSQRPEDDPETDDPIDFFACGKLIPITHGEVNREPDHEPYRNEEGHVIFECDCRVNFHFFQLMDTYRINSIEFTQLKQESEEKAMGFLDDALVGTGLQLVSNAEFKAKIKILVRKWKVPDPEQFAYHKIQQLRGAGGEADSGADSDYWSEMSRPVKPLLPPPNVDGVN